mgnify:CR=1 FL=1
MAQPTNQFTIKGNGFQGLNTEMSPIASDPSYALLADNCVIDRVGRIAAREAFASEADLGTSIWSNTDLTDISAHYTNDGYNSYEPHPVCTILNGTYYPLEAEVVRSTWGGVETMNEVGIDSDQPYEYTLGWEQNGQINPCTYPAIDTAGLERSLYVHFKEDLFLFSRGNSFLKYDGNGGWEDVTYTPPQTDSGNIVDKIDGDVAISAYGRLWVSGVDGDYQTIYYSSLLREDQWYDGQGTPDDAQNTAGIINVSEYWPVDFDQIVNIHAHNGFLIVLGRRSILIYANANTGDPAGENGIQLQDAISNVGLVERDAICNIGTDVMFCDDTGLRSLARVIQEKSTPIGEPSMNVKRQFMDMIQEEERSTALVKGIKLAYFPSKSLVVCLFRTSGTAYTFSTERPSSTGGAKTTRWTDCHYAAMYFAEDSDIGRPYLAGLNNRGVLRYEGFNSPEPYRLGFESVALGITQNSIQTVIPKSVIYIVLSPAVPVDSRARWGFGSYLDYHYDFRIRPEGTTEWGVAQFGLDEYVGGRPGIWRQKVNTIGAGEFLRVGLEIEINGSSFAIQEIAVNTAVGRIAA